MPLLTWKNRIDWKAAQSRSNAVVSEDVLASENGTFVDDFEAGEFVDWNPISSTGSHTVTSSRSYEGDYSYKIDLDNNDVLIADRTLPGNPYEEIEVYWQEDGGSFGHGYVFEDANGDRVFGFGTDNPQWTVYSANGWERVNDGDNGNAYNIWTRFFADIDWKTETFEITMEKDDGSFFNGTFDFATSGATEISRVFISNNEAGQGSSMEKWTDKFRYTYPISGSLNTREKAFEKDVSSSALDLLYNIPSEVTVTVESSAGETSDPLTLSGKGTVDVTGLSTDAQNFALDIDLGENGEVDFIAIEAPSDRAYWSDEVQYEVSQKSGVLIKSEELTEGKPRYFASSGVNFEQIKTDPDIHAIWPLQEDSGASVVEDIGPNGYDGEFRGGVTPGIDAYNGRKGYNFNGSDGYCPIDDFYNSGGAIPEMTVMAWFRSSSSTTSWAFLDYDRSEYFTVAFSSDEDGTLQFATTDSGYNTQDQYTDSTWNDGNWHHVAMVYDGADKIIYVDAQEEDRVMNAHGGSNIGTGITRYGLIGNGSEAGGFDSDQNDEYYEGDLFHVFSFDAAKSQSYIQKIYEVVEVGVLESYTQEVA